MSLCSLVLTTGPSHNVKAVSRENIWGEKGKEKDREGEKDRRGKRRGNVEFESFPWEDARGGYIKL